MGNNIPVFFIQEGIKLTTTGPGPDEQPEDPEEFAEDAGTDPTPQQIDEYRERIGDPLPEPEEPPD